MSVSKYESEVKYMAISVEQAYERFSDMRNLESLREKLNDPATIEAMGSQVPADKLEEAKKQLESMEFDRDSVSINSPLGQVCLRIIERDEPKCIKFESEGAPILLNLWIQLLPHTEGCKMRVTVGAEVNMFMKAMVAKPLQQAADQIASMLALVR